MVLVTESQSQNDPSKIRVLSYNLFIRPLVKTNESDYKDARLEHFAKTQLSNFDIFAFQEMFGTLSSRKRRLIEYGKSYGLPFSADIPQSFSLRLKLKIVDSGLLILSRYPIVQSDSIVFSSGTAIDLIAAKGALWVLLKVAPNSPDGDHRGLLMVVTTHLQAIYGHSSESNRASQTRARNNQILEMREFMKKKRDAFPLVPMILLGDLNTDSRKSHSDGTDSDDYIQMLKDLDLQENGVKYYDHVRESNNGTHPVTTGEIYRDEEGKPVIPYKRKETVLTGKPDQCSPKCLDYLLYLTPKSSASTDFLQMDVVKPLVGTAKAEPFFVDGCKYTQLSDHYGVSGVFDIPVVKENGASSVNNIGGEER